MKNDGSRCKQRTPKIWKELGQLRRVKKALVDDRLRGTRGNIEIFDFSLFRFDSSIFPNQEQSTFVFLIIPALRPRHEGLQGRRPLQSAGGGGREDPHLHCSVVLVWGPFPAYFSTDGQTDGSKNCKHARH